MISIKLITSIGFRCYGPEFLIKYKLRTVSGPFDYVFIDIETALININDGFKNYLTNISSSKYEKIHYMAHKYPNKKIIINNNFVDIKYNNIYKWNRILLFYHNDITKSIVASKIKNRISIFKKFTAKYIDYHLLFYITRIKEDLDLNDYIKYIDELRTKYSIETYMVIIVCSSNVNNCYTFRNKVLYIVKKVKDYEYQFKHYKTDNNLNYDREFTIMSKYFMFDIMDNKSLKLIQ